MREAVTFRSTTIEGDGSLFVLLNLLSWSLSNIVFSLDILKSIFYAIAEIYFCLKVGNEVLPLI